MENEQQHMADDAPEGEARKTGGVMRMLLRVLLGIVGAIVLLILIVVLLLQTNWGGQYLSRTALNLLDPFNEARLEADVTGGNFLSGIDLANVYLIREDSLLGDRNLVEVDTLRLRYSLLGLLRGRLSISSIELRNPRVRMHQMHDGSWDLLDVFPRQEEVDTSASALTFIIDDIRLTDGSFAAHYFAPERDSVFTIDDLNAHVTRIEIGDDVNVAVDTLWASLHPPGAEDPVDAQISASLLDGHLVLGGFRLASTRTDVFARGTLRLPDDETTDIHDIDFRLNAAPLAFVDIRPFMPALDPDRSVDIELSAGGTSREMDARLAVTADDGATILLFGDIMPGIDGPVRYDLTGEVRRLDPAIVTGGEAGAMRVSANLRADLEGLDIQRLDGTVRAELFDSFFGEYAPERTVLDARFEDGTATIDLRGGLRGARLATSGTVRPFDETISYNLHGRIESLDVYALTGSEGQSLINAGIRVEGRGIDSNADVNLNLAVDPSTINNYGIRDGAFDLRLSNQRVNGSARLVTEDGFVALQGNAVLTEPYTYQISRGRLENFDVASLMGQPEPSSITGSFSANGRGTSLETLALNADIRLEPSFFGSYEIRRAAARANMSGGNVRLDLEADLNGGAFDARGSLRPFDNVPSYRITDARFRNVNIGVLMNSPDQQSDLTGRVELAGRGFAPASLVVDARLDLAPSSYNRQAISSGEAVISMNRGDAFFDIGAELPEGLVRVSGEAQPFLERPTYRVDRGVFRGVDVGAFLAEGDLSTRLAGQFSLAGEGFEPGTMTLRAQLDLDESVVNRERIDAARIEADVRSGFSRITAQGDLSAGSFHAAARGRLFDERPAYEAEGAFNNVDVARIIHADTLESSISVAFEIVGEGFDPHSLSAEGRLTIDESFYDRIEVSAGRADFLVFDGLIQVDSLALASNVLDLVGNGRIAAFDTTAVHESDFYLDLEVVDLAPVRPLMDLDQLALERGHVEARVYGQPGMVQFDATADLEVFVYNDIRLNGFRGFIAGAMTPGLGLQRAESRGELDYFVVANTSVQRGTYEAALDGDSLRFAVDAMLDGRRDLRVNGTADLNPERRQIVLESLDLRLDRDQWVLLQEASIAFGEAIRIRNLLLYSDEQQLAVDGVINPAGEQNLVLTLESFRLDAIADLFGFEGLGGTVEGFVDLTGPGEAPRLSGLLEADLRSDGEYVGTMDLSLEYADLRLMLDAVLTHDDGSSLTADGSIPLDMRLVRRETAEGRGAVGVRAAEGPALGEVDIDILSENFSINWLMPFLDRETIDRLEGRLDGNVHVGGEMANPLLSGNATVREGILSLPAIGIQLRGVEVDAAMADNRVDINRVVARSGSGTAEVRGSINFATLTNLGLDLRINANRFLAADIDAYRIVADADLTLTGAMLSPVLRGDVHVVQADIYLTEETMGEGFELVELTQDDMRLVEQRFGIRVAEAEAATFDFYDALSMNLSVRTERNTWLRSNANPSMDIQFTGRLDVAKPPGGEMAIFGDIEVIPERSRIRQFGRTFQISTGLLQFNGAIADMLLDLEAEYNVRSRGREDQVVIVLGVTGRLDSLDLQLESRNPPGLDYANIISYIATGRPASESFQLGGAGGAGAGERLADLGSAAFLNQVTGWVEGVAGEELGLDVIEIEQSGIEGTRITAGKYVTNRLFVSVSEPLSWSTSENATAWQEQYDRRITVEYEVTNWLMSRFVRDGSNLRFHLLWEYSY